MKRRNLLKCFAVGATGIAGCTNPGTSPDENGPRTTPNEGTETETGSGTDERTPRSVKIVDSGFELQDTGCSTEKKEPSVTFDGQNVRVTGTIKGNNSCYVAELEDTPVEKRKLIVMVRSYEASGADMCAMCVSQIEYSARITFESELPNTVTVLHNGTEMRTEQRD